MTIEDLRSLINAATYLKEDERKKWVDRLPNLSLTTLKLLAKVFLLAERKKEKLQKNHDFVLGTFTDFFKVLNNYAKDKSTKIVLEQLETESNEKEKEILNQLTNDLGKL